MLTEREWEQFFDLINKIVEHDLPYEEKKDLVLQKVEENSCDTNFEEFVSWFQE